MNTIRTRHGLCLALSTLGFLSLGPNACKSSDKSDDEPNQTLPCASDKDCRAQDLLCDSSRRVCVECLLTDHCEETQICLSNSCIDVTRCTNSRDCPDDEVCSTLLGRCVDCVTDLDCEEGQKCAGEQCRPACKSDKDCQEFDLLCAAESGFCVDCSQDSDCGKNQYCNAVGTCVPDVCEPDSQRCEGDQLLTCNETGSGYSAESCSGGCSEEDDEPVCAEGEGEGGRPNDPVPSDGGAPAEPSEGGAGGSESSPDGGTMSSGGASQGGSAPSGGTSSGGTTGGGGTTATGGSSGGSPSGLEPTPVPCALFTTCPSCCSTVGVFAIDADGDDYTAAYVTSFIPSESSASATFSFQNAGDTGVIYFKLTSLMSFADLAIARTIQGGSFELALSRDDGASGCVYLDLNPGWLSNGCWGTGASASSWDQVEVRVVAAGPGTASLSVTNVIYE